jgi:cation diffusion facilitator family transporter
MAAIGKSIESGAGITAAFLIGIGILQIYLGEVHSKSVALTANGIDCIGDGIVSLVVWVGLRYVQRPADSRFHFGYHKMENLASAGAAIVMVQLAIYIYYRSYQQFIDPHEVENAALGISVALFAGIVALVLGIRKYRMHKGSNLKSVRLETFNTVKDATASFLAVAALAISSRGYPLADSVIGFIIATVIVGVAITVFKEASYVLADGCDTSCIDQRATIGRIIQRISIIRDSHILRLRRSGPVYQGEMVIEVPAITTISEVDEIKHLIQEEVKNTIPDLQSLIITAVPFHELTDHRKVEQEESASRDSNDDQIP